MVNKYSVHYIIRLCNLLRSVLEQLNIFYSALAKIKNKTRVKNWGKHKLEMEQEQVGIGKYIEECPQGWWEMEFWWAGSTDVGFF